MAVQPSQDDTARNPTKSNPTKRTRWATQKVKGTGGKNKRASILDRFHKGHSEKKRDSGASAATSLGGIQEVEEEQSPEDGNDGEEEDNGPRQIYFNIPLPADALDENGNPKVKYVRNKIRTAKYTPLSFVPKNLWYQFHNIANCYFLFLIILAVSLTNSTLSSALIKMTITGISHFRCNQSWSKCSTLDCHCLHHSGERRDRRLPANNP